MYHNILIPTDGSEYNHAAISHGLALAKMADAEVTAIFVVDESAIMSSSNGAYLANVYPILEEEGKKAVEEVREQGQKMGVKVTTRIDRGSPAKVIIDESVGFDLVVMGSMGRSGVSKLMLGSVAEKLVRLSQCPVLVVKNPKFHG
ncbi:MAG TPA: universal stress protein [Methanomassiliicoccales archaeon]|jgi:nucleotide-binding universal stress UspA family protein